MADATAIAPTPTPAPSIAESPPAPPPNPLERQCEYGFAAAEVDGEVEREVRARGAKMKLKGFRQGKAPLSILRQHLGEAVLRQALARRAQEKFQQDARDKNLRLATAPAVAPQTLAVDGQYKVVCYYEILPEITPADLSQTTIKVPALPVGEAEIDEMIEILRAQQGVYVAHEGAIEAEHRIVADIETYRVGNEDDKSEHKDHPMLVAQLSDELRDQLLGKRAGDEARLVRSIAATDSTPAQTSQMNIRIKTVERLQKPEVDAAFFQTFGLAEGSGMDGFRKMVREHLEREVTVRLRNLRRKRAFDSLVTATAAFALPQTMIYRECQSLWQTLHARSAHARRGKQKKPPQPKPEEVEMLVPEATRRVQLGLILSDWQARQQPEITPADVDARLAQIAEDYEDSAAMQQKIRANGSQMEAVRLSILEDKIVDWVYAQAKSETETLQLAHLLQDPAAASAASAT